MNTSAKSRICRKLDVYKRQEYDDEEDFAYEIVEECYDLPEFAKTYFDYKPVSYTHLDVYKRQEITQCTNDRTLHF